MSGGIATNAEWYAERMHVKSSNDLHGATSVSSMSVDRQGATIANICDVHHVRFGLIDLNHRTGMMAQKCKENDLGDIPFGNIVSNVDACLHSFWDLLKDVGDIFKDADFCKKWAKHTYHIDLEQTGEVEMAPLITHCKDCAKVSVISTPFCHARKRDYSTRQSNLARDCVLTITRSQGYGDSITSLLMKGGPDGKISQGDIDKIKDWFAHTKSLIQECVGAMNVSVEAQRPYYYDSAF